MRNVFFKITVTVTNVVMTTNVKRSTIGSFKPISAAIPCDAILLPRRSGRGNKMTKRKRRLSNVLNCIMIENRL